MARMASELSADKLKDLARRGAEIVLKELRAEIIAIERTFTGSTSTLTSDSLSLPAHRAEE